MKTYVYAFAEGNKDMKELLGGKGANLCEMTNLGLPVPPGFIISTEACRYFFANAAEPAGLREQIAAQLSALEISSGKQLGDPRHPLLLSVRSGSKFSMPGMMETILNIGLNDETIAGLSEQGGHRFAWDCYRRLIVMFGKTVRGITAFPSIDPDADPQEQALKFRQIFSEHTGEDFPQDPMVQLTEAIWAVFRSWSAERAVVYRRQEHIPDDLGTAVNVMAMVFGNLGADSGTGVAFTRDPANGEKGVYGDYLPNAQGEDVVAGIRNTLPLQELKRLDPQNYAQLMSYMDTLERHYRDLCDIEFTIEQGKLWMLQTRVGKRTAEAAFIIASQLATEGLISLDEALSRVTGGQLIRLMFPAFDPQRLTEPIATGAGASPGAAVGRVVFDAHRAAVTPGPVILVRRETNPDDLPGMLAAQGILTSRGGKTSHAAVVARGLGKTCVCGAEEIAVDADSRTMTIGTRVIREGDYVSIDGTTGAVYLGQIPVTPPVIVSYLEGSIDAQDSPLLSAVDRLLRHADGLRRLGVLANADTPEDAQRARRFGAEGIGLCRTEHMFLGERRELIERIILAESAQSRERALDELLVLQRNDFIGIFSAMDGLPVIVRLLDPPLHEFLPSLEDLVAKSAAGEATEHETKLLAAARRMHEQNPMLGLRGVRLGLVIPELYIMQARAIAQAEMLCREQGLNPRPEIMIPLIASAAELQQARQLIGGETSLPIGTMIELPRAVATAGEIARHADFFSFGTNDLTQTTWGLSRDDAEAEFFPRYLQLGIFDVSPFETLDRAGVGKLIEMAVADARDTKPDLSIGVCGEHGGDPDSIHFFATTGFDYVSCSPFRIPVARLEAGRAVLLERQTS
ncbi:pyruvate, phosphate dikinase [Catelliglobosispora koreensis]|uniref:pyruvate, phosphate dikinase n=1 Tax=Catelliglobosispora koreensis TaxID=129052 RepID=UPI0003626827|nr:pyruvate, phosphate dikinase [Catelliglobosispora koreensis]